MEQEIETAYCLFAEMDGKQGNYAVELNVRPSLLHFFERHFKVSNELGENEVVGTADGKPQLSKIIREKNLK